MTTGSIIDVSPMTESRDPDRCSGVIERDDSTPLRDTQLVQPSEIAREGLKAAMPPVRIGSNRFEASAQVGTYLGWQLFECLHGVAFEHQRIHGESMRNVQ